MIGRLPRLLSPIFPACAFAGAAGLPIPPPLDFTTLKRPRPKNSCLAAAPGMHVLPDIVTRSRDVPPSRLFAALRAVADGWPRTTLQVLYGDRLQAHYVCRSEHCNFPDLIAMQITPDATPLLYSRSVYGERDFAVNRRRLIAWLSALDAALVRS